MAATLKRRPLQGVLTIIRFNWHLHAIALTTIGLLTTASILLPPPGCYAAMILAAGGLLTVTVSLIATYIAYDASGLYSLNWLAPSLLGASRAANIHAGFDETTTLLKEKHPEIDWLVFDFYDPAKHTELSIRRARKAHPPHLETRAITTRHIPLEDGSLDRVVLVLAAHEIRDRSERIGFFREIRRVLADDGLVIVTEHLRDLPNIAAYSIGAWHFHPRAEWHATFMAAGLEIRNETKTNLLITTHILAKHGTAP